MLFRLLLMVHRWVGVALCVLFLLWFPSGIGLMYWGMPAVTARDREQYDYYYLDRTRRRPLPAILALMHDADRTRYYIDPKTATIVGSYSERNWARRFFYNALHSLSFPWLYNHRPLWDIVVIAFMIGGTSLCVTSLVQKRFSDLLVESTPERGAALLLVTHDLAIAGKLCSRVLTLDAAPTDHRQT